MLIFFSLPTLHDASKNFSLFSLGLKKTLLNNGRQMPRSEDFFYIFRRNLVDFFRVFFARCIIMSIQKWESVIVFCPLHNNEHTNVRKRYFFLITNYPPFSATLLTLEEKHTKVRKRYCVLVTNYPPFSATLLTLEEKHFRFWTREKSIKGCLWLWQWNY